MIILKLWMDYRTQVLPREAPEIMIRDTRRAFYGGCKALFNFIGQNITQTPNQGPSQTDMNTVAHINAEIEEFCVAVEEGRA